jgi:hypothetical protein
VIVYDISLSDSYCYYWIVNDNDGCACSVVMLRDEELLVQ